jgi:hypothetical protein
LIIFNSRAVNWWMVIRFLDIVLSTKGHDLATLCPLLLHLPIKLLKLSEKLLFGYNSLLE